MLTGWPEAVVKVVPPSAGAWDQWAGPNRKPMSPPLLASRACSLSLLVCA